MNCKNCGLEIEKLPLTASAIEYRHSTMPKYVICAMAKPEDAWKLIDSKNEYLIAEPVTEEAQ